MIHQYWPYQAPSAKAATSAPIRAVFFKLRFGRCRFRVGCECRAGVSRGASCSTRRISTGAKRATGVAGSLASAGSDGRNAALLRLLNMAPILGDLPQIDF